jgi:hypothetical protein
MSAYRYTIAGRPVIVAGRAGKWWYKIGATPTIGDQLTGRYSTRADALAAATDEINTPTVTNDTLQQVATERNSR